MILGSISLLGGTPGASRAALDDQVGSQADFLMVFKCLGGVFWRPRGPFGDPWARLGATLGVTLHQKLAEETQKETFWCTLHSRVHFEREKGRARTRRMCLNIVDTEVFAKCRFFRNDAPK